jgi:hypothetical protein
MRVHAFSGGAARLSTGGAGGYAGLRAGAEGGDAAGITELDDTRLQNEHSDIDMHASAASLREHGCAAQQTRAEVCPWQLEDVIQFLSKDGDSEVIYLGRERALRRSEAVPGAVGEQTPSVAPGKLPVIEGFFCKKNAHKKQLQREIEALRSTDAMDRDGQLKTLESMVEESVETIDVHQEAQELMNLFTHVRASFDVRVNPQPCFKDFTDSMQSARGRNVRLLHLAGHGNRRCGFFWLKSSAVSTEYEEVPIDRLSMILKTEAVANGGTIECVVLNACETEEMGKKLRKRRGVARRVLAVRGAGHDREKVCA